MTKKDHMLQAAMQAKANNESNEIIVACLLHDIGHLLAKVLLHLHTQTVIVVPFFLLFAVCYVLCILNCGIARREIQSVQTKKKQAIHTKHLKKKIK